METMTLVDYLKDRARRAALIAALGTSYVYLWQIANNWRGRRTSPEWAIAIERHTGGVVPRWITRPDLWDAPDATKAA
jgi:hypothetical protein